MVPPAPSHSAGGAGGADGQRQPRRPDGASHGGRAATAAASSPRHKALVPSGLHPKRPDHCLPSGSPARHTRASGKTRGVGGCRVGPRPLSLGSGTARCDADSPGPAPLTPPSPSPSHGPGSRQRACRRAGVAGARLHVKGRDGGSRLH